MEWERFWKGIGSATIIYFLFTLIILFLLMIKGAIAEQYLDPQYTWHPRYYFKINLTDNLTGLPISNATIHLAYDDSLYYTDINGSAYFEVPENITYYIIITKYNMQMVEIRKKPNNFYSTNFTPSFVYVSNLPYHNYLMTEANNEQDFSEVATDLIVKTLIGLGMAGGLTGTIILLSLFYNRTQ